MAEIIPREFIDLLLSKIDIIEVINAQIPLRKKSGSNYFARCPFHNEKSASFSVSQPKQFYYCFGCGAHGNVIDFLMQHERLNFPEAIEMLARQASMEIPRAKSSVTKKEESLPDLYDTMLKAVTFYYEQMRKSPRAINYLKLRGISGNIAQQFHLGYAPSGWDNLTTKIGKTPNEKQKLLKTGLIISKNEGGFYDRFRDRIIFPIYDYRGRAIGLGGRILDQGDPKYLNSPETPLFQKGQELYGLHQALKTNSQLKRVLIVEGYMDVITLFQNGITYAVATLGTATSTKHIERLLRYTSEIIFCFDGDTAGRTAASRAMQIMFPLMNDNLQIRFLFLPEGEDPDTLVRKEGKAKFEARINEASSLSTFFFQHISQQCDLETIEGRAKFAAISLQYIKQLPATLFQNLLVDEVAKRSRLDHQELKEKIAVLDTQVNPSNPGPVKLPSPLRLAIVLLIQNPSLAKLITQPLPILSLPGYKYFLNLIEIIHKSPNITTGGLIELWRNQKEETFMFKLAHFEHSVPEEGLENEFKGALRQVTVLGFENEINRLLAKGAQKELTDAEKNELTDWIKKKKLLTNNQLS